MSVSERIPSPKTNEYHLKNGWLEDYFPFEMIPFSGVEFRSFLGDVMILILIIFMPNKLVKSCEIRKAESWSER